MTLRVEVARAICVADGDCKKCEKPCGPLMIEYADAAIAIVLERAAGVAEESYNSCYGTTRKHTASYVAQAIRSLSEDTGK